MGAKSILFPLTVMAMVACSAPREYYTVRSPFVDEEWQQGRATGTASITGQAFLKTRGGGVRTCAGERVVLLPYNSYTAEIYAAVRRGAVMPQTVDPRIQQFTRTGICSAQGDFAFSGLPGGRWLIISKVTWEVPQRYGSLFQGGELAGIVETVNGQATRYYLTDENLIGR